MIYIDLRVRYLGMTNYLIKIKVALLEAPIMVLIYFFYFGCYNFSKPVEPDRLFDCLPNSLRPSSGSPGPNGESSGRNPSNNHSEQKSISENAVYTPPTLIPPRILPLLHDLAQQMVQAGHQQQLLKIYR